MNSEQFKALRREYICQPFTQEDAHTNPFKQFEVWLNEAIEQVLDMPNAMTLATVSAKGDPEARLVLLKQFDEQGFTFFTNYESNKGQALESQKKAYLLFYWSVFDRQIRIKGEVERVSREESEVYFKSRPIDSQIAAIVSPQSQVVESRAWLETQFAEKKSRVDSGETIELPEHWGGYRVVPSEFEFWQGRENRLHDRLVYSRVYSRKHAQWSISRLAP